MVRSIRRAVVAVLGRLQFCKWVFWGELDNPNRFGLFLSHDDFTENPQESGHASRHRLVTRTAAISASMKSRANCYNF
jgi:hypothetical protein